MNAAEDKCSILFVDQYSLMGGGQQVLIESIRTFVEKNFRVGVLIPRGGELAKCLRDEFGKNIRIFEFNEWKFKSGRKSFFDFFRIALFAALFFRFAGVLRQYSFVHCNGGRIFLPIAALSIFFPRIKFSYHVHLEFGRLECKLLNAISRLNSTSALIFASHYLFRRWKEGGYSTAKSIIVENALSKDYSNLIFDRRRFLEGQRPLNLAVIGRISPEKGQDALVVLKNKIPQIRIHIIGSNDFADDSYLLNLKAHLGDCAIFHGKIKNIPEALSQIPIHFSLVPSRWEEPFGLVAVESMAASCITIVRSKGGLTDIGQKTSALLFDEDSEIEIILRRLLGESPDQLFKLAQSQYRLVQECYSPNLFRKSLFSAIYRN